MERDILWESLDGPGLEHLQLRQTDDGVFADGLVIRSMADGAPFRLRYRLRCDRGWRVREVCLELIGGDASIDIRSDEDGVWTTADRKVLTELDNALDVDVSVTPFTNTLPIRRLGLEPGSSAEITVAYMLVPEMQFQTVRQRYTCLERGDDSSPAGVYRYESLPNDFSADITVDEDGLVLDYPGLFRRVG